MLDTKAITKKTNLKILKINMMTWSYMNDIHERTVVYTAKRKSNTKSSVIDGVNPNKTVSASDDLDTTKV